MPPLPVRGRGARSNATGRFESLTRHEFDDGWTLDGDEEEPAQLRTVLQVDASRTIIARNDSPDIGFARSINPYRGCEHGCIYCFARPTHAFHDLSPVLEFESKLFAKPDAPKLLRHELMARNYVVRPIAFGTNTDPYQPIEGEWRITRACLEVLQETLHPFTITT